MKTFSKILGAVLVAGAATFAVSAPASAAVSVGVGIGPDRRHLGRQFDRH